MQSLRCINRSVTLIMPGPLPPSPHPAAHVSSRASLFTSTIFLLYIFGPACGFLVAIPLHFILKSHPSTLILAGAIALTLDGIVIVILASIKLFFHTQSRLSEWIITLMFIAAIPAVAQFFGVKSRDIIPVIILGAIWGFVGSALGWHMARLMNETNFRRRVSLMIYGWMFIPGTIAAGVCLIGLGDALYTAFHFKSFRPMYRFVTGPLLYFGPCLLLLIPGIRAYFKMKEYQYKTRLFDRVNWIPEQEGRPWGKYIINFLTPVLTPVLIPLAPLTNYVLYWLSEQFDFTAETAETMPEDVCLFFTKACSQLQPCEFESPSYFSSFGQEAANARYVAVLRSSHATAYVIANFCHERGCPPVHGKYLLLETSFSDGTILRTFNKSDPGAGTEPRELKEHWFPEYTAEQLAKAHLLLVSDHMRRASLAPTSGDPCELVALPFNRELNAGLASRYLKRTSYGVVRLTIKGAILLSLQLLWPIKQIKQCAMRYSARQALTRANARQPKQIVLPAFQNS